MDALTPSQQQLVVDHMGLVDLYVRQQARRLAPRIARCQHDDMVQEGMLGLMEAARRYRSRTCGTFAAYASSYIRGAICKHLRDQVDGLAIPSRLLKQAFQSRRRSPSADDPQGPGQAGLPRFYDLTSCREILSRQTYLRWRRDAVTDCSRGQNRQVPQKDEVAHDDDDPVEPSDSFRSCYERAVHAAAAAMKAAGRGRSDHAALIDACVQERLLVTLPQYRTSNRELARRFGSSTGRIHGCQRQLLRLVRRQLAADPCRLPNDSLVCRPVSLPDLPRACPATPPSRLSIDCQE